jgi:hypothetical protein
MICLLFRYNAIVDRVDLNEDETYWKNKSAFSLAHDAISCNFCPHKD